MYISGTLFAVPAVLNFMLTLIFLVFTRVERNVTQGTHSLVIFTENENITLVSSPFRQLNKFG